MEWPEVSNRGVSRRPAGSRVYSCGTAGERVFLSDPAAEGRLSTALVRTVKSLLRPYHDRFVILAIGTDRSTGDALGPLVGSALIGHCRQLGIPVFGTLECPVHARNLEDILRLVQQCGRHPLVLALDACLGKLENVGSVRLRAGPLHPGAGVNKQLPAVGDLHITATVNVGGFMEYFVLQNTRLSLVMSLADLISRAIRRALRELTITAEGWPCSPPLSERRGAD